VLDGVDVDGVDDRWRGEISGKVANVGSLAYNSWIVVSEISTMRAEQERKCGLAGGGMWGRKPGYLKTHVLDPCFCPSSL
jgi:hypothetical protein